MIEKSELFIRDGYDKMAKKSNPNIVKAILIINNNIVIIYFVRAILSTTTSIDIPIILIKISIY